MPNSLSSRTTVLARFSVQLNLPDGPQRFVEEASEAVKREYRTSVRWKRLRCRNVEPLTSEPGIFVLEVGHSFEFDWTWEGAIAFRSSNPNQFAGDFDTIDDFAGIPNNGAAKDRQTGAWAGEVVEVDESNGRLFVSVTSPEIRPCRGTFFVRPFEFLSFLNSLYCQPNAGDLRVRLAPRLNAARGDVHPPTVRGAPNGLEQFKQLWRCSWAILWGPPGCGKTTSLGRQVAACLDGDERVLVVSTTNKATDEAAFAIGRSAESGSREAGRVLRIGKGAAYHSYMSASMTALLRGTETDLLRQIGSLTRKLEMTQNHEDRAILRHQIQGLRRSMKDSAFNIFVSPQVNVVVATAFKAVSLLNEPEVHALVVRGEAPFTTVVIDEAGLMSRAVVAGMSLLAARRVVVVGDAKQLAPISKVSRVLPTSQAVWLSSSCLTHLQRVEQAQQGVHFLREQHRMHPQVSQVVSRYQYEGALQDAQSVLNRAVALPPLLMGQPRALWYVLDEDGQDLPDIRAERGLGNRSWIRRATRQVLEKLFLDSAMRKAKGLFITPFKAQAKDITGYLAAKGIESWSSGTVHARQGTEADLVIFDTVNAGSCGWPYDEWKRLVNVGLSRAREFVLAAR